MEGCRKKEKGIEKAFEENFTGAIKYNSPEETEEKSSPKIKNKF